MRASLHPPGDPIQSPASDEEDDHHFNPKPLRRHRSHIPRSRKEAFKSFENLVALANDQEKWKLREVGKAGKKLVWRDVGEAPVLLENIGECIEHAASGGLRAGCLAFGARSGVNLFILFFTYARTPKNIRAALITRAIFCSESFRFAAMIGWFVTSYKFILNLLPIIALRIRQRREQRQLELKRSSTLTRRRNSAGEELPSFGPDITVTPAARSEDRGYFPDTETETETETDTPTYLDSDNEYRQSLRQLRRGELAPGQPPLSRFAPLDPRSTSSSTPSSYVPTPRRIHFSDVENQVRLLPPSEEETDHEKGTITPGHLSTATQAASILAEQKGFIQKRWYATLAGALSGGVAILMEQKERRLGISQQLFVRGLQGSYSYWSNRLGIQVPFGSVLVFSFCCGQIMYGFLLRPDTTPHSYNTWIQKASIVPEDAVTMNRELVDAGIHDPALLERIVNGGTRPWNGSLGSIITPKNREVLLADLELAKVGSFGPRMAPCAAIHPHFDSCITTGLMRIWEVGKWMAPMYGALHFIPMILFKHKVVAKEPVKMLLRALVGTVRSASFLGIFVAIYQSYICLLHFAWRLPLPEFIRRRLLSRPMWWLGGILSGLSLLVEERRRRAELAMYVLPKGLESGWKLLRGELLGIPSKRKRGWKSDSLLCAVGMSMVMTTYQHDPHHLSGLVRRLLYQFVGTN